MKQTTVVFRTVLLIVVAVSFAACSGGVFVDPGHGGAVGGAGYHGGDSDDNSYTGSSGTGTGTGGSGTGTGTGTGTGSGTGGGSGAKPTKLSNNATYNETLARLDEIIAYCNNHPGTVNNQVKASAETQKSYMPTFQSAWSTVGLTTISGINSMIDLLQ
jgi:hypothetical protein